MTEGAGGGRRRHGAAIYGSRAGCEASEPEVVSKTAVSLREVLVAKYSYTPEEPGQNFLRIENSPTRCIP
jgi:hypothetical protein